VTMADPEAQASCGRCAPRSSGRGCRLSRITVAITPVGLEAAALVPGVIERSLRRT
jgi:hypothetical protein